MCYNNFMKTKEKIFLAAEKAVLAKGFEGVTMAEIAKETGISTPALYKHFKNKEDLYMALAKNFTQKLDRELFPFDSSKSEQVVHDWLWTLCNAKYQAYMKTPEMFKLYVAFLEDKYEANREQSRLLMDSFAEATGIIERKKIRALFDLFAKLLTPAFLDYWDEDYPEKFERMWEQVAPYYKK